METGSHTGCAWIVDQLIGIRDREQQLMTALASSNEDSSMLLDFRVAELNLSLEMLDRALDEYGRAASEDRFDEDRFNEDRLNDDRSESFAALAHG